jgi:hypothetical protein
MLDYTLNKGHITFGHTLNGKTRDLQFFIKVIVPHSERISLSTVLENISLTNDQLNISDFSSVAIDSKLLAMHLYQLQGFSRVSESNDDGMEIQFYIPLKTVKTEKESSTLLLITH